MRPRTVLSLEQALSMPYATLRFVGLGWRVIRIESVAAEGGLPGDPNRYIGSEVVDGDRRSYFVAPNVGKEAIALNLKDARGREALHRIMRALHVDVFCCNTLPSRYEALGVDYETLRGVNPRLIWAAISAMGAEYPKVPGYDPAIQAMAGYMELTGHADGPPTLCGVPLIDLKAGDEVFAQVMRALVEQAETGTAQAIHVSMLQAAASWLITTLPLVDFDCDYSEITRCGNEHRKFIPTNVYATADGFVYLAIGSDAQWKRLTEIAAFRVLANDNRVTNSGRRQEREAIHRELSSISATVSTADIERLLAAAAIPHAPIHTVPQVRDMPAVVSHLTTTSTPAGKTIRMQPMAVDAAGARRHLPFAPSYGEHTRVVLTEAGYSDEECDRLQADGVAFAAMKGPGRQGV